MKIVEAHRACVTTVGFDGRKRVWTCKHAHYTAKAAALCGQNQIRRITPNTRDTADRVQFAGVKADVEVKTVQHGQEIWLDWAALNNLPTL